jgi:hypothetical protein
MTIISLLIKPLHKKTIYEIYHVPFSEYKLPADAAGTP